MKYNKKLFTLSIMTFVLGLTIGNYAISDVPSNYKVAVVDVQKVISSSSQVKALKEEQKKKSQELAKFVETAKTTLDKEKDPGKKKVLETKYNKEFQTKRTTIAKNYETKLLAIDKSISAVINEDAKAKGYDLVLAKGVVLSGGIDITSEISAKVK